MGLGRLTADFAHSSGRPQKRADGQGRHPLAAIRTVHETEDARRAKERSCLCTEAGNVWRSKCSGRNRGRNAEKLRPRYKWWPNAAARPLAWWGLGALG